MNIINILEIGQSFEGVSTNNKLYVSRTLDQMEFGKTCHHFQGWEFWEVMAGMLFIRGENHGKLQSESKWFVNIYKHLLQKNLRLFCSNIISNKRNVEANKRETCGSCNETGEMEVDQTYTEEGFLCRRETSLD